jgi:hypothetical protein
MISKTAMAMAGITSETSVSFHGTARRNVSDDGN